MLSDEDDIFCDAEQGDAHCDRSRAIEADDDEDIYADVPPLTAEDERVVGEAIDRVLARYKRRGASELLLEVLRERVERGVRLHLASHPHLRLVASLCPRQPGSA